MKYLLIISMICACSSTEEDPTYKFHQTEVTNIVWNGYFNATEDPPPVFWWETPCPTTPGDLRSAVFVDNVCYAGLFRPDLYRADVAWNGAFSNSAFVHELLHAYQLVRGIHDPDHVSPEWADVWTINWDLSMRGY